MSSHDRKALMGPQAIEASRTTSMAELYAAHAPYALRLAYLLSGNRELARDLVQEAFTKILGRFGDLRGPEAFQAYLRTTIINLSRKHFHRRVQERSFLQRESRSSIDRSIQLPNVEEQNEMWMLLQQLPPGKGRRSSSGTTTTSPKRRRPMRSVARSAQPSSSSPEAWRRSEAAWKAARHERIRAGGSKHVGDQSHRGG